MTIETYPMMNAMITDILRTDIGNKVSLYAAQRIEELEAEAERWRREFQDEQVRRDEWEKMYNLAVSNDAYWKQYYEESQPMRIRLMRESRIRKVCLEIAMEALRWYDDDITNCREALDAIGKIEARLTELEIEPAPDALPCGQQRTEEKVG